MMKIRYGYYILCPPGVGAISHVVNLDYKKAVSTTLLGPGAMEVFHPATKVWTKGGSRLKLDLPPGGGVLVRLAR